MLKKYAHLFSALLWLFDMAVLALAFVAAYAARFFLPNFFGPARFGPSPVAESVQLFIMSVPLWTVCFVNVGLYGPRRTERSAHEVFALLKATLLALLLLVFTQYFSGGARYSRGVILLFGATSFVMFAATRMLARKVLSKLRMQGFNLRHALVIGTGCLLYTSDAADE